MGRATVRDVARLAGLSIASVSRALKEPGAVRPETNERVKKAAAELGYRLNRLAIDFRTGRSHAVMVLVPNIANPFYTEFFKGIEEEAWKTGYIILIGDTAYDAEREAGYFGMLTSGKCDGVISHIGRFPSEVLDSLRGPAGDMAIVSCNIDSGIDLPSVTIDDYQGGCDVAEHLLALGHRRFGQILGYMQFTESNKRRDGFAQTIRARLPDAPPVLEAPGDLTIASGRAAARALMAAEARPTALFAHSDEMAIGAIAELRSMGLSVPRDVSVVGFDDLGYAASMAPTLTTLRSPRREWGAAAFRMLLGLMSGDPAPRNTTLPVRLLARESSGISVESSAVAGDLPIGWPQCAAGSQR